VSSLIDVGKELNKKCPICNQTPIEHTPFDMTDHYGFEFTDTFINKYLVDEDKKQKIKAMAVMHEMNKLWHKFKNFKFSMDSVT